MSKASDTIDMNLQEKGENTRYKLFKLIIGILFFCLSFIFKGKATLVCYLISYIFLGYEVVFECILNIIHLELMDESFLMTFATVASAFLGDYREAVLVMLFYSIGEFAQGAAADKSHDNIEKLLNIQPETIHILSENGKTTDINPEQYEVGTIFNVLAGERIPVDGIVVSGSSSLDTKAVTGESLPVEVAAGSEVVSGSLVLDSPIKIKGSVEYKNSTVNRIITLIEENSETKAKTEKFITEFSRIYTPCVVILAIILAVLPTLLTGNGKIWIHRALSFLVISCPCALVLSVPLAFFAGLGSCAKEGILVKGAEHLETLSQAKAVVFDKTGTLTKGVFTVTDVVAKDCKVSELLSAVYSLESQSNHPIAKSITEYCTSMNADLLKLSEIKEIPGQGITAVYNGIIIAAGNGKLMHSIKAEIKEESQKAAGNRIYVASDGKIIGYVILGDEIRENAFNTVKKLREEGIEYISMLSGDKNGNASEIAKALKLNSFKAELLPQNKAAELEKIMKQYNTVYCGDGINDSPVLAMADTGIAMGSIGSDLAIETADIVIVNDDLEKIPLAVRKAKRTMKTAKQNIIFALAVKALFLIAGSFGITGMAAATFADSGVALLCVLNSMRALL